ncbi:phage tail tape measure protein, partial [Pseudomonas sp. MWU12-2323]|uniref:phage tail tape measure protein n=1 Tax=Pseudomonas sp. MWU12-2323 TaxID=2651296 RepID=UPI00137E78F9
QAIMAGQKGGFELKDMAKWLPQQMAAAKLSGISGMPGMAKLLAANQAAVITAGSKDEAGNNLVNLLTKINSQDTARDAAKISATTFREKRKGEQGIDLPATLARGREKGMDSLDSFVGLTEKVIGGDKRYQTIQDKLKRTDNKDERRALLESQGDILQGSAIGMLIQD